MNHKHNTSLEMCPWCDGTGKLIKRLSETQFEQVNCPKCKTQLKLVKFLIKY